MTVKKYMLSLAALMIAMTATVLTSCSKEDVNEIESSEVVTPGTHVEILTIAFPEQPQTRVAMDGDHNLTGWEEGDEVTLVRTHYEFIADESGPVGEIFNVEDTYTFTCTNAANGTFTGTMPDPWTVENCQLAFYNATGFDTDGTSFFYFSPKTRASQNMKDVVMLVAKNDGGNFEMEIFGSILEVTNNTGADITASVKYSWFGYGRYYDCNESHYSTPYFEGFGTNVSADVNNQITLSKDAPTYVYIPVYDLDGGDEDFAVGLSAAGDAANECSIVPFKTNPGNAKLFKKTLTAPTTGTAKATIDGNEVDVNWVQLWAGGPKFAEYNVGASAPEEYGGYFAWGETSEKSNYSVGTYLWGNYNSEAAPKYGMNKYTADAEGGDGLKTLQAGDDPATVVWGENWRTPTSAEFEDLVDPNKCEWTWDDEKKGYTVEGLETGNTIFLPAAGFRANEGTYRNGSYGYYWSSSVEDDPVSCARNLNISKTAHVSGNDLRFYGESVRAVLK